MNAAAPAARLRAARWGARIGAALAAAAALTIVVREVRELRRPMLPPLGPHQSFRHGRLWSAVPVGWDVEETIGEGLDGVQFRSKHRLMWAVVWIRRVPISDRIPLVWNPSGERELDVASRMAPLTGLVARAARAVIDDAPGGRDPPQRVIHTSVVARGECADFVIDCDTSWEYWQSRFRLPHWQDAVDWCLRIPPTVRETKPCR